MATNTQWRGAEADAHEAKADALRFAAETVEGIIDALEPLEQPSVRNAVAVMERARERHDAAGRLAAVA